MMLNDKWKEVVDTVHFSFQPIVNVYSGVTFGFEIFTRGYDKFGYGSVEAMYDAAYREQVLAILEIELRKRAVLKFMESGIHEGIKLFYRFDKRVISMPDYYHESVRSVSSSVNVFSDLLCLEISEKHGNIGTTEINALMAIYGREGYKIAIDDYGTGCFSFRMLYNVTPDYIKIDRFFIQEIEKDMKKKRFVTNMVNMAQMFGVHVIAKGLETQAEYYVCKEIGINLIQGYLIHKPSGNLDDLKMKYPHIEDMHKNDKRKTSHKKSLEGNIEYIAAININDDMLDVLEKFRKNKTHSFLPVVDTDGVPLGIVKDKDLKDFVYSAYGTALLKNKSAIKSVSQFLTQCGISDVHSEIEAVLEVFTQSEESIGILITEDMKYKGFMSSSSLLTALNEKNLAVARDQNPLTKLPGNNIINEYIAKCLGNPDERFMFAYFDFDNFKPFNDKYGFRNGDRAILLFADLMKEDLAANGYFIGHIGGDDFFAAYQGDMKFEEFYEGIASTAQKFKQDVESFYSNEDRERGSVEMKDREGKIREFPLLAVSAGVVQVERPDAFIVNNQLDDLLAILKKQAKKSPTKLACASIDTCNHEKDCCKPTKKPADMIESVK